MKKLGILGGSFDPIHNGHILLACEVYEKLGLDNVLLIPAYVAPHKIGFGAAPAQDRYRMTLLATEGKPFLEVSDMEIHRTGVSFTYDTMLELHHQYPDYELYFIIGGDTVPLLDTWSRIDKLLHLVHFVAVNRPGYTDVMAKAAAKLGPIIYERVHMLEADAYDVSSTEIRKRIQEQQSLDGLVPEAVQEYIYVNGLYHAKSATPKIEDDADGDEAN